MVNIPIGISLTEEMVYTIDARRGDIPRSRYIQRALEKLCGTRDQVCMDKKKSRDSLDRRSLTKRRQKNSKSRLRKRKKR